MRQNLLKRAVNGALFFVIVGPSFGALPFLLLDGLANKIQTIQDLLAGVMLFGIFAYILGFVPAAIAGIVTGLFSKHVVCRRNVIVAGIFGGFIGAASSISIAKVILFPQETMIGIMYLMLIPGAFSGFVTILLYRKFQCRINIIRI
jgi:hypothetical protein